MRTPINNGLAQSDVDFADFKPLNANLIDYAGNGLNWNTDTNQFEAVTLAGVGFLDNFSDTGTLFISSHTSDSGQSWKNSINGASTTIKVASGSAYNGAGFADIAFSSFMPTSADQEATITIIKGTISGNANVGISLRSIGSATTPRCYIGRWAEAAGFYEFARQDGAGNTVLLSQTAGTAPDNGDTLRFSVSGTGATVTLTLYKNGVQVATYDDTAANRIVTNGTVGIFLYDPTFTGAGNYRIDNMTTPGEAPKELLYTAASPSGMAADSGLTWDKTTGRLNVAVSVPSERMRIQPANTHATNKAASITITNGSGVNLWSIGNDFTLNGAQDFFINDDVAARARLYFGTGEKTTMTPATIFGWQATVGGFPPTAPDIAFARNAAGIAEINNGTAGTYRDLRVRAIRHNGQTVATLPTGVAGMTAYVTDGGAGLAWGATVIGGGSTPYLVWYNGTAWTVMGK